MKIKVLKESKYTPFICTVIALVLVVSLLLTLRVLNTNSKSVKLSDKDIAKISNGVETAISNNIDNTVTQDVVYKYLDSYFTEDKVEEIAEEYVEVISGGGQLSDVKFDDNGNPIPSEDSGELEEDGNHSNKDDNKDSNITYKNEDYDVNSDTDLEKLKLSIVDTINEKLVEVKNNISQMSFNVNSMSSDVKNQIAKEVSNSLVNQFNTVSNNLDKSLDKAVDYNKIKNIMMSELSDFEFNLSNKDVTNISDIVNNSFNLVQNDLKGVSNDTVERLNGVQQNIINSLEASISKPVSLNTSDYNNIVNTLSSSLKDGTDELEKKLKETGDALDSSIKGNKDLLSTTKDNLLTSIGEQSTTLTTLIGDKTDILQNQSTQLSQDLTSKTDALSQSLTNKTDTLNQSLNTSTNNITNSLTTGFSTQSSLTQAIKDAIGNPDNLDYVEVDSNTSKNLVNYLKDKFNSLFNKVDKQNEALYGDVPEFDSSNSYSVGDVVQKDGALYKCINSSSGEWLDSNWKQTSVFQSASEGKKALADTFAGMGITIGGDCTSADLINGIQILYRDRYKQGKDEGYNNGYSVGYDKGKSDASSTTLLNGLMEFTGNEIKYEAGKSYPMFRGEFSGHSRYGFSTLNPYEFCLCHYIDNNRGDYADNRWGGYINDSSIYWHRAGSSTHYYIGLKSVSIDNNDGTGWASHTFTQGDRYYFYDMVTGKLVDYYHQDFDITEHWENVSKTASIPLHGRIYDKTDKKVVVEGDFTLSALKSPFISYHEFNDDDWWFDSKGTVGNGYILLGVDGGDSTMGVYKSNDEVATCSYHEFEFQCTGDTHVRVYKLKNLSNY